MISENCFVKGFIDILIPKDNKGSYLWLCYPEIIEKSQCKGLASACMLDTAMPVTSQTQLQILESEAEAQWNHSGDYSYLSLSSVLFCRPKIKGYSILEEHCPHGCKISRVLETPLILCGEIQSYTWWEGREEKTLTGPFSCPWSSFLWDNDIFHGRQLARVNWMRQSWRHVVLYGVNRTKDYESLLNRFHPRSEQNIPEYPMAMSVLVPAQLIQWASCLLSKFLLSSHGRRCRKP